MAASRDTIATGIFLPFPIVVTLIMAAAGVGAAYVFATKMDLATHERQSGDRILTLEQKSIYQDRALDEMGRAILATDQNLRTLMSRQGVPKDEIKLPDAMQNSSQEKNR